MDNLNNIINNLFKENLCSNLAIRVIKNDKILCDIYKSDEKNIDEYTLFDVASVTKMVVTTTLSYIAKDLGLISFDDLVSKYFPVGNDKENLTINDLITHRTGFGYRYLKNEKYNDDIVKCILNIKCDAEPGTKMQYSCPGFILLGKILEKVFNNDLQTLFNKYIKEKLNMSFSGYNPELNNNIVFSNEKEDDFKVNDLNARFLNGVSGNAGLFSNIHDLTIYVNMIKNFGYPIIKEETFKEGILKEASSDSESVGRGFFYVDSLYKQTGKLFSEGSVGHCGHTGQSVFYDFKKDLSVIILSDFTFCVIKKYMSDDYSKVMKIREEIHNAIYSDIKNNI